MRLQVMTKKIRHHQLLRYVNHYTSHLWARRIIPSLLMAGQKAREYNRLQKLDTGYLQSFYGRSRRRLLVFDYDGTLVSHHALAQLSAPPPGLLQVLEALCEVISVCVPHFAIVLYSSAANFRVGPARWVKLGSRLISPHTSVGADGFNLYCMNLCRGDG